MDILEAIVIVLIVAAIVYIAYRPAKAGAEKGEKEAEAADPADAADEGEDDSEAFRAFQGDYLDARTGIRHGAAGYGAHQPHHPLDKALARKGYRMDPQKLLEAEENAWAPYSPNAVNVYDVKKGAYPGTDLTQQLGQYQEGDWNEELPRLAVDARTLSNHRAWSEEVGPFSQGAMTVDNLDEAVAMSAHRQGITAFKARTPAQGPCTLQVTERDPALHATHFGGSGGRSGGYIL